MRRRITKKNVVYYVYLLELNNRTIYAGYTSDLKKRIKDHNAGKSPFTKKFRPVKLIYYSAFESKKKALKFEVYLKKGSGIAFRNKHLI